MENLDIEDIDNQRRRGVRVRGGVGGRGGGRGGQEGGRGRGGIGGQGGGGQGGGGVGGRGVGGQREGRGGGRVGGGEGQGEDGGGGGERRRMVIIGWPEGPTKPQPLHSCCTPSLSLTLQFGPAAMPPASTLGFSLLSLVVLFGYNKVAFTALIVVWLLCCLPRAGDVTYWGLVWERSQWVSMMMCIIILVHLRSLVIILWNCDAVVKKALYITS